MLSEHALSAHVAEQACWTKHEAKHNGVRCDNLLPETIQIHMPAFPAQAELLSEGTTIALDLQTSS